MYKRSILGASIIFGSVLLQACGNGDDGQQSGSDETNQSEGQESSEQLDVYTTLFAWEDFAKQIGGDYVNVENVVPPGSNAHSYDPTPQTLTNIAEGDMFIMTGSGMEGFAEEAKSTVDGQDVSVLEVTNNMELRETSDGHSHSHGEEGHSHGEESHSHGEEGHSHGEEGHSHGEEGHSHGEEGHSHGEEGHSPGEEGHSHGEEGHSHGEEGHSHGEEGHSHGEEGHSHGGVDPHVWLDPVLAQEAAESIKNELVEQMPEQEETFEENYQALVSELESIDQGFQDLSENSDKNQFIVSHAAYGYWEDRYGFEQIPVSGINAQDEPSVQEINDIIATAEENNINTVLLEQNIPSETAETVQNEIGADVAYLHNLSTVTEENIENNATYVSLMEDNIDSLQKALND